MIVDIGTYDDWRGNFWGVGVEGGLRGDGDKLSWDDRGGY